MRLGAVRGFARYLHEADPRVEVPAADLLPDKSGRAVPYLYTDEQIAALIDAAGTLRIAHKTATFRTLFGLLAATGMRIGEAIALDRSDFDANAGTLTVHNTKFGKSRELPLHPSTTAALTRYLARRDRRRPAGSTEALLVSTVGTRLLMSDVQTCFRTLRARAGILPRSAACRPRLHDLRHSFAVCTLLDAYRTDGDPGLKIAALSTYRYCLLRHPEHAATIERVLQIGPKRHERALVTYLTEPELDALIDAPDRASWTGRRDHAIIIVLAQTGLRASELTGLRCGDIHLGTGAHATTIGKGRKQRITPADQRDRRGPPRVARRKGQSVRRAAVSDQHRHAADPQGARPADRQARDLRRRALPFADGEDGHTACAAPHGRDAAAARRGRHHGDRAVARTRTSRNHADVPPRRPRAQGTSVGPENRWTANLAATARQTRSSDS